MNDVVWGLPAGAVLAVAVVVVLGGLVRGFGGFGASMVWAAGMSLFLDPVVVVPTVLVLEILASVQLLPSVWRQVHWRSMCWLLGGVVVGLPVGISVLVAADDRPLRIAIAASIGVAAVLMAIGPGRSTLPGRPATIAVGTASGVLNGAFAIGGPPAILMYFSSPRQVEVGRASLIAFFFCTDALGIVVASGAGLVDGAVLGQSAALWPLSLLGVAIGALVHRRVGPAVLRNAALWLLLPLAVLLAVDAWFS